MLNIKPLLCALIILLAPFHSSSSAESSSNSAKNVRPLAPPAVPLVACDPYFSIWSASKNLNDVNTMHWTGKPNRLASMLQIDGKTYRVMGASPAKVPALKQLSLEVTPTRSIYQFEGAGIALELTFMTPALPADIDLLSRPITYVTYKINSTDGKQHETSIYFSASSELTVNKTDQYVTATAESIGNLSALKIGSVDQRILARKGDDLRIDWGYLYLAAEQGNVASRAIGTPKQLEDAFVSGKDAGDSPATIKEELASKVSASVTFDPITVGNKAETRVLTLAYDDLYSIEFMGSHLRPYWRRNGLEAEGLLKEASRDYASLVERCKKFDDELMTDLENAGGLEYARLAALAFRQCFAAGKFAADANGQPIQFSKENNSNGCIATSDVFYPMAPQFLVFGPSLAKSFVAPFMEYAASDRWTFPFAPHDLGTYPKANGQVYGGGETSEDNQMPVEESGNMLILINAIAKLDGNASFADRYWPQLLQWAEYLKAEGFDPDNQLCTDDFAGHMAHNVNLSAKAICGLGAFAQLCEMRGDKELATEYRATAAEYAARWISEGDDGDHYRLAFDKPGSWSQKYNLVWDRVLGMNLFPESVLRKEMDYYLEAQNRYGLPLDSRREYTKLDWILWTATLTQNQEDFKALVHPVYKFLNETPDHVPMTDWYETASGRKVGFKARPVVGGVFMQLLHDKTVWQKWAKRDVTGAGGYAAMPTPPVIKIRLAAADTVAAEWSYSTQRPHDDDWMAEDFDDSSWKVGKSGFGTHETPSSKVGTPWNSSDIWLRRTFDIAGELDQELKLHVHYDEDCEIYINGVLACRVRGYSTSYEQLPMRPEALNALKSTGNVLAVHCHQTEGGQYIDVGMSTVVPAE